MSTQRPMTSIESKRVHKYPCDGVRRFGIKVPMAPYLPSALGATEVVVKLTPSEKPTPSPITER